uniref:Uncharacterized protein n=1 Tax=uncultured prokaryote TaxID=198431 RepID=A0A0H5Q7L1_9ZZZZ|nr:hypothetical protein [uncultured prokaryote]
MLEMPVQIAIALTSRNSRPYRAHVVGWGIAEKSTYASLWSFDMENLAPPTATATEVLEAFQGAMAVLLFEKRVQAATD